MSSRGFGVWIDTFVPGSLDLSATERFVSKLRFPEKRFRLVFFAGPSLGDVLESYTSLTGRTRVPPPWAFGLWKSRDVHHNQDSVLVDLERLRQYGIPSSVLVLDSPWETGYNNFIVNRTQFPAPEKMFARIRELGFELCLWLTPFVNDSNVIDMRGITPASSNFDEARRHLVKDSTGAVALSRFAAFSPFMQVHMTSNLGPWDFDDETLDIFRRFAVLRTRLFPYLYDAVHESAKSGMPVIRPMVLAFQDDREAQPCSCSPPPGGAREAGFPRWRAHSA
jgi:alpha-glucosidase (family GH31 glycosyl hydrolase)